VNFGSHAEIVAAFDAATRQRYGFIVPEKAQIVEAVAAEVIGKTETVQDSFLPAATARGRCRRARPCACGRTVAGATRRSTTAPIWRPAIASTARPSSSKRIPPTSSSPAGAPRSARAATSC